MIIIRKEDWVKGLKFVTGNEDFIQVGLWNYGAGHELAPHIHVLNPRRITRTQEAIVVLSGSVRVDLYQGREIIESNVLCAGEIGILLDEGHGYTILQPGTKVVEIKNGPFTSVEADKVLIHG